MADRRLLEDGSLRLQEDGSYLLLEQQTVLDAQLAVTEDDDSLQSAATLSVVHGGAVRRRRTPRSIAVDAAPPIEARLRITEDDDTLESDVAVLAGLKSLQRKRAALMLLILS